MKTFKQYIKMVLALAVSFAVASCTDNASSLNLSGNCNVEELMIDGFKAEVDAETQTLMVYVPEDTPIDNMEITSLRLSEGAVADMKVGTRLNMNSPRTIHVVNGDVTWDWSLKLKVMEARMSQFTLSGINGVIDQENLTIKVFLKDGIDISALSPTIKTSEMATVNNNGVVMDFTTPQQFTVENLGKKRTYTVIVQNYVAPEALYVSTALKAEELNNEEKAAYDWMLVNVPKPGFASLKDIADGSVSLSGIKMIFWHGTNDNAVDGHGQFVPYVAKATGLPDDEGALNAGIFDKLQAYYENGGAFFLTRYAAILPPFIGSSYDVGGGWKDTWATPNNCWSARTEDDPEICGGPWTFAIYDGQDDHPLFKNLIAGDTPEVYCTDEGFGVTNSVVCYNHFEGWSEYKDYNHWFNRVQGRILGVNNKNEGNIIAWEFPSAKTKAYGKGGIICIGSGCYDWYSAVKDEKYKEKFHENISRMTYNGIMYLYDF